MQKFNTPLKYVFAYVFLCTLIISCKKLDMPNASQASGPLLNPPEKRKNPYSLSNIVTTKKIIAEQLLQSGRFMPENIDSNRLYTYMRFDPEQVSTEVFQQLESDTSTKILDFPFADMELYSNEYALDAQKAATLADGKLYMVTPFNSASEVAVRNTSSLNAIVLDTLYLPEEEDTATQFEALRQAGFSEEEIDQFKLCLLKRPRGFVSYFDQEANNQQGGFHGVPKIMVWTLAFGIPIWDYTDDNGYYEIPWRFSIGTIMGTHARNDRVTIKPFNTEGTWILTVPVQMIVGSVSIHGWQSSCQMKGNVDINFTNHAQNRYWAQLLHAVHLHDNYTAQD